MKPIFKCAALAATILAVGSALAAEKAPYELVRRVALGPRSHYDYTAVEPGHRRLYVTRGDHVDVLALPSGELVGVIENTEGVHGVAFDEARGVGFTSNGASNSVTVFDLATLRVKSKIALTGKKPDAIVFAPDADKLYVFNGHSDSVDVVDGKTLAISRTIQTSGDPEFAVADGHGHIFFNIENHPAVEVIDTASDRIVDTWPLAQCDAPTGIAIDARHALLVSSCQNHFDVVTDASSGKEVGRFGIAGHPDAVAFDAATQTVFTACGEGKGTLSIADELPDRQFAVRQELESLPGARTLALDGVDGRVYLPSGTGDAFLVGVAAPRKH